ncbi:MAG: CvpA family protein [Candidatus Omnitrophota bacterium]
MLSEILSQLNWVDFFIIIIMIRVVYVSAKTGFVIEFFKLVGIVFALYLSLHYYIITADILKQRVVNVENYIPLEFFDLLVFVFVLFISCAAFAVIRGVMCHFIKMEAVPMLSRWGAVVLGVARGILISSAIIFILLISTIKYLDNSARESYSGKRLFNVAVGTYSFIWDNFMSKLMPGESYNEQVSQIEADFNPKAEITGF